MESFSLIALLELVLLIFSGLKVCGGINFANKNHFKYYLMLILLSCFSIVFGGVYAITTMIKVISFCSFIYLGINYPKIAFKFIVLVSFFLQISAGLNGQLATKWALVPFFLFATCFIYVNRKNNVFSICTIVSAFILELLQIWYTDSRGGLIIFMLALLISAVPKHQFFWVCCWLARTIPILYIIILNVILLGFVSGDFYVEPTASNVERSSLAFWSLKLMPDYIMSGPGPNVFFESVNDALTSVERGREDDGIDPHSFILSYWVGLGLLLTLFLYFLWCKLMAKTLEFAQLDHYTLRFSYAYIASFSIVSISLSAPDSYYRMLVGLACGLLLSSRPEKPLKPA